MRLYVSPKGEWAGTQADAKQYGQFWQIEVPTDKAGLLKFLNDNNVRNLVTEDPLPEANASEMFDKSGEQLHSNSWKTVRQMCEECATDELVIAHTVISSRIHDLLYWEKKE